MVNTIKIRDGSSVYPMYSRYHGVNIYASTDSIYGAYQFADFAVLSYPQTTEDSYYTVDAGYENRLDLISYMVYGTVHYWYIIAIANDIMNPLDVPAGTVLRITPLSVLTQMKLDGTISRANKEY